MKGTIKWYNPRRGYGFITGEDGKEVFVHYTALETEADILENDSVEYKVENLDRGLTATNVKILKLD